jgi:Hpt domain
MNDRRKDVIAKLNAMPTAPRASSSTESRGSYEVIRPRITLRDKAAIYTDRPGVMNHAAIERAEKALDALSGDFFSWMDEEVINLQRAFDKLALEGSKGSNLTDFYRITHDIKGCASTFGFPFATSVASGLAQIIMYCDQQNPPIELMRSHVAAVRAIVREDARGETDATARALSEQLHIMGINYLAKYQPIANDSTNAVASMN